MGTRSTTYILDSDSHALVCMYSQYDGYPEGMGKELAGILTASIAGIPDEFKGTVTMDDGTEQSALIHNGMECLAASVVKLNKEKPFGVYLYPVPSIQNLDFGNARERDIILEGLTEHARRNGSDYMYVIYIPEGRHIANLMCCYLHDADLSTAILYDGEAYKFCDYLEEQKRKADEEAAQLAQPVASPSSAIIPGEFADIECIAMPEYD